MRGEQKDQDHKTCLGKDGETGERICGRGGSQRGKLLFQSDGIFCCNCRDACSFDVPPNFKNGREGDGGEKGDLLEGLWQMVQSEMKHLFRFKCDVCY